MTHAGIEGQQRITKLLVFEWAMEGDNALHTKFRGFRPRSGLRDSASSPNSIGSMKTYPNGGLGILERKTVRFGSVLVRSREQYILLLNILQVCAHPESIIRAWKNYQLLRCSAQYIFVVPLRRSGTTCSFQRQFYDMLVNRYFIVFTD